MTRPNQSIPRCKCGHHYNNHMDWVGKRGTCKDMQCDCMTFDAEDWIQVQQIVNRLTTMESVEAITEIASDSLQDYMERHKNGG